jgi:hypothetical protein
VNNHSYRTQSYKHNELTETTVTSFDEAGKLTITWPPSDVETESEQRWYDDHARIVKTIMIDEGEADTIYYTRDKNGVLQSIVRTEERN